MNPLATFARAPAHAVGAGITATIRAQAVSKAEADSPEAWVHFCTTAADEAYAAVLESPPVVQRELGSAQKMLLKLDRMEDDANAPRLWATLPDDERDRAERSGWTQAGWDASQGGLLRGVKVGPVDAEYVQLHGAELSQAAHHAALVAFRACMPKLTGRRTTQAYIACVATGVQRGYFTGSESKALLYTAQLALSAYPSRRAQRGRK